MTRLLAATFVAAGARARSSFLLPRNQKTKANTSTRESACKRKPRSPHTNCRTLSGKWYYAGPFDNTDKKGSISPIRREKKVDLKVTLRRQRRAKVNWKEVTDFKPGRRLRPDEALPEKQTKPTRLFTSTTCSKHRKSTSGRCRSAATTRSAFSSTAANASSTKRSYTPIGY